MSPQLDERPRLADGDDPKGEWHMAPPGARLFEQFRGPKERIEVHSEDRVELPAQVVSYRRFDWMYVHGRRPVQTSLSKYGQRPRLGLPLPPFSSSRAEAEASLHSMKPIRSFNSESFDIFLA